MPRELTETEKSPASAGLFSTSLSGRAKRPLQALANSVQPANFGSGKVQVDNGMNVPLYLCYQG